MRDAPLVELVHGEVPGEVGAARGGAEALGERTYGDGALRGREVLLPPLTNEQIEAQWDAPAERQRLLRERPNTAFGFIIEEHLFLRGTGGTAVTRELIDHVLEISELRNVEIQIMPLVRASHAGLHGPMQLLETPDNRWFAYTEAPESGQLLSDQKIVSVLKKRYARMRSQALTLEDSMSLLQRMRGAL